MARAVQVCSSFSLELYRGVHDFDNDTIKLALFTSDASLGASTTAYSTSNEVVVSGYTAGGVTLTAASGYPQLVNGQAAMTWQDPSWTLASALTFRYGLIYNSTESNRAICVLDTGGIVAGIGDLTIRFPTTLGPLLPLTFAVQ